MPEARCIIHVGSHKTGTTSIQSALSENREQLLRSGCVYPSWGKKGLNHNDLAHHLAVCADEELAVMRDHLRASISDASQFLLLSAEELSTRISNPDPWSNFCDGFYWENRRRYLEKLRQVLHDFRPIEVCVSYRNHEEYAHSLYSTKILSGKVATSFSEFVVDCRPIFDYLRQVDVLRSVFGTVRLDAYESSSDSLRTGFIESLGLVVQTHATKRLNQTPALVWIAWIADSLNDPSKVAERKLRTQFCKADAHQELIADCRLESLWRDEHQQLEFFEHCTQPSGLNLPGKRRLAVCWDQAEMSARFEALEQSFEAWRARQAGKGRRWFHFWK